MQDIKTLVKRDDRTVVGFHGTSIDRAQNIVGSGEFVPSQNDFDWLGHGVYFWEHAPLRAWQWATSKYRDYAAVVEVTLALGACLDLSDVRYTSEVKVAYDHLRSAFIISGKTLPTNKNKARCLDCFVLNYLTTFVLPEVQTVRAPFLEGEPIFEGSSLLTQSHIQLVVRDSACIVTNPKLAKREVSHGN